jgi:glutathione S-transferase
MHSVIFVIVLALMQYIFFGALVAKARSTHGIAAPAMGGSDAFERLVRVHLNTLERLVLFIPLMWFAAQFWNPQWVALVGVLFLIGRLLYWKGYVKSPEARGMGNVISMLPVGLLLLATLAGLVRAAWM